MTQFNRADRDRYPTEEIHYVERCYIDGCMDDVIGSPDGGEPACFKHYNYEDF
jgi:hypothetical protein